MLFTLRCAKDVAYSRHIKTHPHPDDQALLQTQGGSHGEFPRQRVFGENSRPISSRCSALHNMLRPLRLGVLQLEGNCIVQKRKKRVPAVEAHRFRQVQGPKPSSVVIRPWSRWKKTMRSFRGRRPNRETPQFDPQEGTQTKNPFLGDLLVKIQ